jgi:hypothetical protein
MPKKRLKDRKKLIEAGRFAKELLTEKGLQLPKEQSAIDRIFNTKDAPTLPGVPAYLPYPWTIHAAKRVLYDLSREWELNTKNDFNKSNNISEFFKHVISSLKEEESVLNEKIHITVQTKKYDFRYLHQKDSIKGIRKLLVDSFAVSIIAKSNTDVATYLEWFQDWSDKLVIQWGSNIQKIK